MGVINTTDPKYQTYSSSQAQKLDWPYYDTIGLPAAGTEFNMFSIGLGGLTAAGLPKMITDTNLPANSATPNGQIFEIRAIRFEYTAIADRASADLVSLNKFLSGTAVRFSVVGMADLFSSMLPEIMGIPVLWHNPTAATINETVLSKGRFSGIRPLNVPIMLNEQTSFNVRLNFAAAVPAALVGDLLRCYLEGFLIRAS